MARTPQNVDVCVGGSTGSEGKGKLLSVIATDYGVLVRTGACNAAHTTYFKGEGLPWHQISCVPLHAPNAKIVLGAGAQIDMHYLNREIGWLKDRNAWLDKDGKPRLMIDKNATIIEPIDVHAENGWAEVCGPEWYAPTTCAIHNSPQNPDGTPKTLNGCEGCHKYPKESLHRALGSTTHGSGFNLIRKLARVAPDGVSAGLLRDDKGQKIPRVKFAHESPELAPYIGDTVDYLNQQNDDGVKILLEGTQGSGLSLHHGPQGKTTSRDTNVSNWLTEAGLSPHTVRDVYMVARTFPIRVFGNSGPMGGKEITWEDVTKFHYNLPPSLDSSGLKQWLELHEKKAICEITTATKRMRRVFEFSASDFKRAVQINRPTHLMLTFVDYLDYQDFGKNTWESLTSKSRTWIENLEYETGVHFDGLSTGPDLHQTVWR